MYKYIVLYMCVSLSGVLCVLYIEEGAECEWEGLKGKCVQETRCMTTLDEDSPKHPICSRKDGKSIICCTDCELVNNTENAVFSPTSGLYWKDGRKARDKCLQYLEELPYQCKQDGFYGGISRDLDGDNKCYKYYNWAVEGEGAVNTNPSTKYPYRAILGFGRDPQKVNWGGVGFIISDKYIVTTARTVYFMQTRQEQKFAAMGVNNLSDSSTWQIHKINRFIPHPTLPDVYHDIALIQTDTPIMFDENVLPACLHVEKDASVEDAVITSLYKLHTDLKVRVAGDTIQMTKVKKFSEQECTAAYSPHILLDHGFDVYGKHMCYGIKSNRTNQICEGSAAEPLMITTQFSSCVHTAIGLFASGPKELCGLRKPDVYTRIALYVGWIENIVWP